MYCYLVLVLTLSVLVLVLKMPVLVSVLVLTLLVSELPVLTTRLVIGLGLAAQFGMADQNQNPGNMPEV